MKLSKKIISFMLVIMMTFSVISCIDFSAFATEQNEETVLPNRAEWLSILVEAFDMTVEEDNYPDNYFSDIDDQSPYYCNIMVATEFGFIDIEPGNPVNPEGEVTREFAAHTLNTGLGFVLDGAEDENYTYSFVDSEACSYPVDDQIAVDKGWLTLDENNNFNPNENISLEELDVMLDFTLTEKTSDIISDDYDSKYDFADGVIVVPNGTEVSVDENDVVTITDLTKTINVGDSFVVFLNNLPAIYEATKVTTDGNNTIIETKKADNESALESVDMQEVTEVDLSQFEPAEGFDVLYPSSQMSKGDSVSLGNTSISLSGTFKIMDGLSVELKGKLSDIVASVKQDSATGAYIAKVDSKLDSTVTIKAEYKNDPDKIPIFATPEIAIGKVRIMGIGYVKLSFVYSISGSVTINQSYNVTAGVAYKNDNLKLVKSFKKDDFSIAVAAEVKVGFRQELGIDVLVLNANINNEFGFKGRLEAKYYNSGLPKNCLSLEGYLYWTVGAEVSVKFGIFTKKLSASYDIFDSKNSPIKIVLHFEDGNKVYECTRSEGKYITSKDSNKVNQSDNTINDYISTSSDFEYSVNNDNTATITKYIGSKSNLVIPKYIDGYKVTRIGSYAFEGCTSLTSVTIPNSVTRIGDGTFEDCRSLTSVTIPNSVTSIGDGTFEYCESLTSVTIPNSVTSIGEYAFCECTSLTSVIIGNSVTSIGEGAFYGCKSLKSVTIPDSVTSIGSFAFVYCESLTSVTIPNSVTSIAEYAFFWCESLTSVTIPNSVTSIGDGAFRECTGLTSVTIPNSVTSIGNYAFSNCTSSTSITIPNSVTSIGIYAFSNCKSLTSVTIPNSVTIIGECAFWNCTSLTSVIIGNSVISIGEEAFEYCESLTSVTIPNSVTSIGEYAFYDCQSLSTANYKGTKAEWNKIDIADYNTDLTSAKILCSDGVINCNHTYDNGKITKASTCTATGVKTYSCTVCGEKKTETVAKKAHSYNSATCTSAKTCKVCGSTSGEALGHTWDAGKITKSATCTTTGVKTYTCTKCSATKTETIAKKSHTLTTVNKKSATCTADGYTGDKKCSVCGTVTQTGTSVAKLGHNYQVTKEAVPATCTTDGNTVQKTCTRCKKVTGGTTVAKKGHKYVDTVVAPTCTAKGYTKHTCSVCGYNFKNTYVDAKGHTGKITVTKKATTKASGTRTNKCTVCGKVIATYKIAQIKSVTLSATSYTYDGKVKKPTVTVKDVDGNTISSSYYTVSYASGRKNVGTYKVTVTFKTRYSGTVTKTFKINPKATSMSTLTATTGGFKATWKKQSTQTTGYILQYSTNSDMSNYKTYTSSSNSTLSKSVTGLSKGKKYYVRVRTYKTVDGTKYYSGWSSKMAVTTKK